MKPTSILLILCSILIITACKKSEDPATNNNNNGGNNNNNTSPTTQLLIAGKWQTIASTATLKYMGKDTTVDLYKELDACKKDNTITFTADGKCTSDEGANICPGYDQKASFPWTLLNNDTRLALVDDNPDTFNIEITTTQLKLTQVKPNSSGTPVTRVEVLKNIK